MNKRKHRNRQMYKDHLAKQKHDGYEYPNCPVCWKEKKVSICDTDATGHWVCQVCNVKWTVVA